MTAVFVPGINSESTIIEKCIEAVLEKVAKTIQQLCKICSDQFEPEHWNSELPDSATFVSRHFVSKGSPPTIMFNFPVRSRILSTFTASSLIISSPLSLSHGLHLVRLTFTPRYVPNSDKSSLVVHDGVPLRCLAAKAQWSIYEM